MTTTKRDTNKRKQATRPVMEASPRKRRATVPVPVLEMPPAMRRHQGHQRSTRVEQPLDPPEFEGSALALIREKWAAEGSPLPDLGESETLLNTYRAVHSKVEAARKELHEALEKESVAIVGLANAFGGNSLRIDGVVHDFASRGDTIFFRRRNVKIIDT